MRLPSHGNSTSQFLGLWYLLEFDKLSSKTQTIKLEIERRYHQKVGVRATSLVDLGSYVNMGHVYGAWVVYQVAPIMSRCQVTMFKQYLYEKELC